MSNKINKTQFLSAAHKVKKKLNNVKESSKKFIKKIQTRKKNVSAEDMINEFQKNNTFKDIYYNKNDTSSIQAIISTNPKSIEMSTRVIGSQITQNAKQDDSELFLKCVKLVHPDTMPDEVKEFCKEKEIEEIHSYLGACDTDSFKILYSAVFSITSTIKSHEFSEKMRYFMVKYLKDSLDRSDDYFAKYNLQDKTTKKKLGTFGFDEIENDITTVLPENQLKIGIYLGPKKYYEESFKSNVKMKHAGTSNNNQQICYDDYNCVSKFFI